MRLLVLLLLSFSVAAQESPYPKSNIEITVLFPAGSSADITARILAEGMQKHLGVNVLVINRPGGGGAIGYKHVAAQKPDGYSLVWNSNSISTTFHSGQLDFDYHACTPIARVLVESPILAVKADAPWKTLAELVADARARPGKISVANSGTGSHTHICAVALFRAVRAEVVDVPHGAQQVVPNLLGGHVDATVQLPGALSSHIKSGSVRVLAALIPKRDPALPDAPTAREQGVDVSLEAWRGVAAPKGLSIGVVAILEHAIRRTVESPEFVRASEKYAVRPAYLGHAEFGELIAKEDQEIARLLQVIGLKKP